jgi:dTDP-4-dehydrorhamnose 3,5-epimerase
VKLTDLPLAGALLVEFDKNEDERGYFARIFCRAKFLENGLQDCSNQNSLSFTETKATLRGMHFQRSPHEETKLVRCVMGAVYDVIVDLRQDSPTYRQWHGVELSEANGHALYIPKGFAHGYQTLIDGTAIVYQIADPYVPDAEVGFAWNDPDVGIVWRLEPKLLSARDRSLPSLHSLSDLSVE